MAYNAPIETKVKAATAAATITAAILWLLDTYVFTSEVVPEPVEGLVQLAVLAIVTFVAGYAAKHTNRNEAAERGGLPPQDPYK